MKLSILGTSSTRRSRNKTGRGVYFRKSVVDFGKVAMGGCGSAKLQLCNPHSHPVVLRVSEPGLPFICTHRKVRIKAKSFVNVPVKVVPVSDKTDEGIVKARDEKTGEECVVLVKCTVDC